MNTIGEAIRNSDFILEYDGYNMNTVGMGAMMKNLREIVHAASVKYRREPLFAPENKERLLDGFTMKDGVECDVAKYSHYISPAAQGDPLDCAARLSILESRYIVALIYPILCYWPNNDKIHVLQKFHDTHCYKVIHKGAISMQIGELSESIMKFPRIVGTSADINLYGFKSEITQALLATLAVAE